jgi:hypothetical protein
MNESNIRVLRSNGDPLRGARVVLSFTWGQTHAARTDDDGWANVSHESAGRATIFVDGSSQGSIDAPGSATVRV